MIVAGAAASTAETGTSFATSASRRGRPTFVLVPGSHGDAEYLAPLTAELSARGFPALTVEAPGHGPEADVPAWYCAPQDTALMATAPSSIASVTLADATRRLVEVIRRVAAHGPVILVGHSLGGAIIGTAGNAVPHLIDRIVYVSAFCVVTLPNVAEYSGVPENDSSAILDPTLLAAPPTVGALRVNWRTADPAFLEKLRSAYLDDGTLAQFRAIAAGLQPDESLRFSIDNAQVKARTWGRIPRTYVQLTEDRATPVALQDRMIREADALTPHNPFEVRELAMSHLALTIRPKPLADILTSVSLRF
jgi:alpha-beta hydrolase superfamily lysophospholipase